MGQYFIAICSLSGVIDSIYIGINFHLKPGNKQPTKNKTWKKNWLIISSEIFGHGLTHREAV